MRLDSLTLALTAFNEEKNLESTVAKALEALPKLADDYELILVDDGSDDRTPQLASTLANSNSNIRFLQHSKNRGMGAAIRTAIENASKTWFCTIAADGQVDPNDLQAFLAAAKTSEAVFSTYSTRRDGIDRWVLSTGVRVLLFLATGIWKIPTGNYFIQMEKLRQLDLRSDSFVVNYEVFLESRRKNLSVAWTELPCHVRESGRSHIRNLKTIYRVFKEVLAYRMR